MIKEWFVLNLKQLMGEMTQQELSSLSGIGRSNIANYFSRGSMARPEDIERLAEVFRVKPHYFFMEPGTQGELRPLDNHNDFAVFLNEVAEKHLRPHVLEEWKTMGSPNEFVRMLRANYETDEVWIPQWFLDLTKILSKYSSIDLVDKVRQSVAKRNERESAG